MSTEPAPGSIRVLVVEDDPRWLGVLCAILEADDSVGEIATATTADQARANIDSFNPTLIVTDLVLDVGMDETPTVDLCLEMLERLPGVPLVVLSGWLDPELAENVLQAGASSVLSKASLDPQTVHESIVSARRDSGPRAPGQQRG